MVGLFVDFGSVKVMFPSDSQAQVLMSAFPRDAKLYYYLTRGWYASVLILAGARNLKSYFIKKSWMGSSDTAIEYQWEAG